MTDWIDFSEVREKVSLEDVLLRMYGLGDRLKRTGDKLVGCCPIHQGDSPRAFHADLKKNAFFCFSKCAKGGNALDFVAAMDKVSVREAALKLRAAFLSGTAPPLPSTQAQPSTGPPKTLLSAPALAPPLAAQPSVPTEKTDDERINPPLALRLTLDPTHPHLVKDRGLSLEVLKRMGIGYCARGSLRGMIAIPIEDEDNELVAFAGRRLKGSEIRELGKYKLPKGFRKELVLYNLPRAKARPESDGFILCEGFFSVVALIDRGIENAVASMGCILSEAQADLLAELGRHVTVLYDGNEAGRLGAASAKALLDKRGIPNAIVYLPEGAEPEDLPPRLIRWAANGVRLLDLSELRFAPRAPSA